MLLLSRMAGTWEVRSSVDFDVEPSSGTGRASIYGHGGRASSDLGKLLAQVAITVAARLRGCERRLRCWLHNPTFIPISSGTTTPRRHRPHPIPQLPQRLSQMSDSEGHQHVVTAGKTLAHTERPRYKSWRKKYRKMRSKFEGVLEENKNLFKEEQKLEGIASRLREELE